MTTLLNIAIHRLAIIHLGNRYTLYNISNKPYTAAGPSYDMIL